MSESPKGFQVSAYSTAILADTQTHTYTIPLTQPAELKTGHISVTKAVNEYVYSNKNAYKLSCTHVHKTIQQ